MRAAALEKWMRETGDQGHIPEKPEVLEYWDKAAQEAHGRFLK